MTRGLPQRRARCDVCGDSISLNQMERHQNGDRCKKYAVYFDDDPDDTRNARFDTLEECWIWVNYQEAPRSNGKPRKRPQPKHGDYMIMRLSDEQIMEEGNR